jgi:hypothetical protein
VDGSGHNLTANNILTVPGRDWKEKRFVEVSFEFSQIQLRSVKVLQI